MPYKTLSKWMFISSVKSSPEASLFLQERTSYLNLFFKFLSSWDSAWYCFVFLFFHILDKEKLMYYPATFLIYSFSLSLLRILRDFCSPYIKNEITWIQLKSIHHYQHHYGDIQNPPKHAKNSYYSSNQRLRGIISEPHTSHRHNNKPYCVLQMLKSCVWIRFFSFSNAEADTIKGDGVAEKDNDKPYGWLLEVALEFVQDWVFAAINFTNPWRSRIFEF